MTREVEIVQLSPAALDALAAGDLERARTLTDAPLDPWLISDEAIGTWRHRAAQVVGAPQDLPWVTGLLVVDGACVGKAGFHAAPTPEGMVEIGYAVVPSLRRRGHARAALALLVTRAHAEPGVRVLRATVSPDNVASRALLASYSFVHVGEQWDEEDGLELVLEMPVG